MEFQMHEFEWSTEDYSLRELAGKYASNLPLLIRVNQYSVDASINEQTADTYDMYWLYSIENQERLVVQMEDHFISVPTDFSVPVNCFCRDGSEKSNVSIDVGLRSKCDSFEFVPNAKLGRHFGADGSELHFSTMEVLYVYKEPYFLCHGFTCGTLKPKRGKPITLTTDLPIRVCMATELARNFAKDMHTFHLNYSGESSKMINGILVFQRQPTWNDYSYVQNSHSQVEDKFRNDKTLSKPAGQKTKFRMPPRSNIQPLAPNKRAFPRPIGSTQSEPGIPTAREPATYVAGGTHEEENEYLMPTYSGCARPKENPYMPKLEPNPDEVYECVDDNQKLPLYANLIDDTPASSAASIADTNRKPQTTALFLSELRTRITKVSGTGRSIQQHSATDLPENQAPQNAEGGITRVKPVSQSSRNAPDHRAAMKDPLAELSSTVERVRNVDEQQPIYEEILDEFPAPSMGQMTESQPKIHSTFTTAMVSGNKQATLPTSLVRPMKQIPPPAPAKPTWTNQSSPPPANSCDFTDISKVPRDLTELTVEQVCQCLALLNMDRYIDRFRSEFIDGKLLCTLDEHILEHDIGIGRLHVKKLMAFIDGWRPQTKDASA